MSAFIVTQEHISAMLQAATPRYSGDGMRYHYDDQSHPMLGRNGEIGQILLNENYRSVNHRHSESAPAPKFTYRPMRGCSAVELIKLCNCYRYQSCETLDWPETEAYAIWDALRGRAIDKLPGYEDAMWSFDPTPPKPEPKPEPPAPAKKGLTRDETIKRLRAGLKAKTGKSWTVKGGRGTGRGWIKVEAPPRRRVNHEAIGDPSDPARRDRPYWERFREVAPPEGTEGWYTLHAEAAELAAAFGLRDNHIHLQGINISPGTWTCYLEAVES